MLGHFSASSLPEAVAIRRQLLPPNPSSKAIEAFFGPHHDGVSAEAVDAARISGKAAAATTMRPLGSFAFMSFPPLFDGLTALAAHWP
jgi:hypothetical protein